MTDTKAKPATTTRRASKKKAAGPKIYAEPIPLDELFDLRGIELAPGLSLDEWGRIGDNILHVAESGQWWLGDWYNYGENNYGEDASQHWDERFDLKRLEMCRWVARNVPFEQRRHDLKWSLHKLAAGIPNETDRWTALDIAEAERPTYREFEEIVARFKPKKEERQKDEPDTLTYTLSLKMAPSDADTGNEILAQLEKIADQLIAERRVIARIEAHRPSARLKVVA